MENTYYIKLHKTLNSLIYKSKRFCENYCIPDGLMNILTVYNEAKTVPDMARFNGRISYDFDYFAFMKSTKSLMAIRQMLNAKEVYFNEDCFMQNKKYF